MQKYQVEWIMEFEATSHEDAARQALAVQRDPSSLSTVFEVYERDENGRGDDCIEVDLGTENNRPWLTHREAQELHELIGSLRSYFASEHFEPIRDADRALELAALLVSDTTQ